MSRCCARNSEEGPGSPSPCGTGQSDDVDDRRATALVILPPSATHEANGDTATPGVAYARETMERRGAGQRQYRNALVFVAPDTSKIDAARENARRERAWRSIVDDVDLRQQLTQAQTSEAEREARRSRDALQQSVRSAWVQVLHPGPPNETRAMETSEQAT